MLQGRNTDFGEGSSGAGSHTEPLSAPVRTADVEERAEPDGMPPGALTDDVPAVAPRPVWIEPVTPRPLRRRLLLTILLMLPMLVVVLLPVGRVRLAAGVLLALTYLSLGVLVWTSRLLARTASDDPADRTP